MNALIDAPDDPRFLSDMRGWGQDHKAQPEQQQAKNAKTSTEEFLYLFLSLLTCVACPTQLLARSSSLGTAT